MASRLASHPRPFWSRTLRILAASAALTTPALAQAADCPVTLAGSLKPGALETLTSAFARIYAEFGESVVLTAPPKEVASTARETLPVIVRSYAIQPDASSTAALLENYFGADYKASPDVFILPLDARVLCQLLPGQVLFLSDGATHHYAIIGKVDYARRTITLNDPWADVSFLREGYNLLGVAARPTRSPEGKPTLEVGFADLLKVLRGRIVTRDDSADVGPRDLLAVMETLYPELPRNDDYLFWKYSRLIPTAEDSAIDAASELAALSIGDDKPRLKTLQSAISDLKIGVLSNFQIELDFAHKQMIDLALDKDDQLRESAWTERRDGFLARLPDYARTFNSQLKLWMLRNAHKADDPGVELAIAEAFQAADPKDIDLQIARVRALLEQRQTDEAQRRIAASLDDWRADVASGIAVKPREAAVAWFFDNAQKIGLRSDDLSFWRWGQLTMLSEIAALQKDPKADVGATEDGLRQHYHAHSAWGHCFDFLADCLWISQLAGDDAEESAKITEALKLDLSDALKEHFADEVYAHVRRHRSIAEFDAATRETLKGSYLAPMICERWKSGPSLAPVDSGAFAARLKGLADFCAQ